MAEIGKYPIFPDSAFSYKGNHEGIDWICPEGIKNHGCICDGCKDSHMHKCTMSQNFIMKSDKYFILGRDK